MGTNKVAFSGSQIIVADHVYTRARQTTFWVLDHAWNGAPTRGSAVVHIFVVKRVGFSRDHHAAHAAAPSLRVSSIPMKPGHDTAAMITPRRFKPAAAGGATPAAMKRCCRGCGI